MNEFLVKLIANGGSGSGNFNPGQGRGIGKPGSGSKSSGTNESKSKKGGVGPAKITKKELEKILKPGSDGYTREITEVKYNPDEDRYEAKAIVRFKDKETPDDKEFWFTNPAKDPKEGMNWFRDNSPTWLEELSDRLDETHERKRK